jgi:hypothetical protein
LSFLKDGIDEGSELLRGIMLKGAYAPQAEEGNDIPRPLFYSTPSLSRRYPRIVAMFNAPIGCASLVQATWLFVIPGHARLASFPPFQSSVNFFKQRDTREDWIESSGIRQAGKTG